ncbi:CoA pyrophosphatase [Bacteroidetes/Chlorobi group bacterium ChocPot_Mid]|nr:MAG: CoA pyrophosphatase [Bacteroidetes/Chlorobi group bacterium ChocPot_Mid]
MNHNHKLIEFLKIRLANPLTGLDSQKLMAPTTPKDFFRTFKPTETAQKSAVLILLINNSEDFDILFTLRSKNISHSGQISFPGGRCDLGESAEQTALRETFEETGIKSNSITLLGRLTDLFVPPSDNIITPVVGYMDKIINVTQNSDEVEEIFFVPLKKLISSEHRKIEQWNFNGINVNVPLWDIHPTTPLWGATAMITSELVELCKELYKK